ncbi:basic secretory protein-like protein [Marinifilum fragile]|uniref:basic secretory protein-like protein n=1 Tax=Marinifilum fragile TaxID=570161 RepID=UPI002AA74F7E|nr:basic secretory protein-like protein [Marinifilum fragile]
MIKNTSKLMLLACVTALLMSCNLQATTPVNVTGYKCEVMSDRDDSPVGEDVSKLVDGDIYSKYLTFNSSASIQFTTLKKCKLSSYSLVSGGDSEERDPMICVLEASNDKKSWQEIDRQKGLQFSGRNQKLSFPVSAKENYKYYRLQLESNGNDILQLSEVELLAAWDSNDNTPIALFKAENRAFFTKGLVEFSNLSVQADAYHWYFKGGKPETSTAKNPKVKYESFGKYPVQLIAENKGLKDTIILNDYVNVKRKGAWNQFSYPKINFVNKTLGGNGDLYTELVPNPKNLINTVCLDVCKILYRSVDEVDVLNVLDYSIEDLETISAKGGNPPHINIFFSSLYLKNKKGEMSDMDLVDEIVGVLYHELAHGYQYSPKGAGAYAGGTDFFGFLEGIADYVRLKAGYSSYKYRKIGGHWNDGYKTTAFFIDWLHTKDPDFVYKMNQTAKTIIPWSWDEATNKIFDQSTQSLWDEYQAYLKANK